MNLAKYQTNIQKLVAFLYIYNEIYKRESKKKEKPFKITLKST